MKGKLKYLVVVAISALMISCGAKAEKEIETETVEAEVTEVVKEVESTESEEITDPVIEEVVESKYHYDEDWERFKIAVINSDLQGVGAFASSDAIDAQVVIDAFAAPDFMAQLKAATYDDLTTNDTEFGVQLVFSASVSGSDEEGNEYESGVYLYFSQGELSLELDNVLAAG